MDLCMSEEEAAKSNLDDKMRWLLGWVEKTRELKEKVRWSAIAPRDKREFTLR